MLLAPPPFEEPVHVLPQELVPVEGSPGIDYGAKRFKW